MREATQEEREGVEQYIDSIAELCEDCISRDAVHGLILPWLNDYLLDETREVLETIDYKIEDLPPVTPAEKPNKWIPVSERLPEPWKPVLWTGKDGSVYIKHFDGSYADNMAWMPLPTPYKSESEDKK